jgi:metal-dependent amidase/aminoacylase/carboxypeptidase family protein
VTLESAVSSRQAEMVDVHRHPELAFAETATTRLITDRLTDIGAELRPCPTQTGVVAALRGTGAGPTVMHACGHDAHTAILLTVADVLADRSGDWPGNVILVFQPAEELGGGAQAMIDGGRQHHSPSFALDEAGFPVAARALAASALAALAR